MYLSSVKCKSSPHDICYTSYYSFVINIQIIIHW